jgi:hypothetical protein
MALYTVIADAWMYGKHYKVGDKIDLNAKQAKYEIYSGTVAPIATSEPKPVLNTKKKPDFNAKDL